MSALRSKAADLCDEIMGYRATKKAEPQLRFKNSTRYFFFVVLAFVAVESFTW